MQQMVMGGLGVVAIVILALVLSSNKTGAQIIQGGLIIAILAVLLNNTNALQGAMGNLTRVSLALTNQQSSS